MNDTKGTTTGGIERMDTIKNATLDSASIEMGDRGFLSAGVTLDYGDSGFQGFGHSFAIHLPKNYKHWKLESVAGHHIMRLMQVAGVDNWDKMKGRTVRVKCSNEINPVITAIGHITKNDWFCPAEDYKGLAS